MLQSEFTFDDIKTGITDHWGAFPSGPAALKIIAALEKRGCAAGEVFTIGDLAELAGLDLSGEAGITGFNILTNSRFAIFDHLFQAKNAEGNLIEVPREEAAVIIEDKTGTATTKSGYSADTVYPSFRLRRDIPRKDA